MRNAILCPAMGGRALAARCMRVAASAARPALGKTAMIPWPMFFTTRPPLARVAPCKAFKHAWILATVTSPITSANSTAPSRGALGPALSARGARATSEDGLSYSAATVAEKYRTPGPRAGQKVSPSGYLDARMCDRFSRFVTSSAERDASLFVLALAHVLSLEDAALADPLEGLFEHFLRVGLEHDALARPPAPRVHHRDEARRELLLVVMRIELRAQIDVALGFPQRAVVLPHVLRIGLVVEHGGHHEGGVDHLAEAHLLEEVIRAGEHGRRGHLAVEHLLHAGEEDAIGEGELDVRERHVLLERLDGRIVAARLVADRNRHAAQVFRRLDRRLRRHEYRRWRHRIGVGVHLGVALRGGDVHRPVAGTAHVRIAPRLDVLVGADLVRRGVRLGEVLALEGLAELVVQAFGLEIAFLLGSPLVQPEMRGDQKLCHVLPPR